VAPTSPVSYAYGHVVEDNNDIKDNVYSAVMMTAIARVHPVHAMIAEQRISVRRPLRQTDRLES